MNFTAKQIAKILKGKIIGNSDIQVSSIAKIEDGKSGDLCFLANPKYASYIYSSSASIVIVNKSFITSNFVASLELAKNGFLDVKQEENFGKIYLKSRTK